MGIRNGLIEPTSATNKPTTGTIGRSLLTLNDDVLLAIVSFLSKKDALELSRTARGIHSIAMRQVTSKLRKLSMSVPRYLDPMDVFEVLKRLSNLHTLEISDTTLWGEGRRSRSQSSRIPVLPSIKRLDIHHCRDVYGLRLSPVQLSFNIGTRKPSCWEMLLGNLPRLRVLEVKLIGLCLKHRGKGTLIRWTMFQEHMLCLLPAHIACLKIQEYMVYSVDETSLQIAMDPEILHSLPQLVAKSTPSMELFAVGLADCSPNPDRTRWTRIRVNGDNQRVVEAIDPTTEPLVK
ncbi:hypothetical protein IEO21_05838 [Rhodonia placenta]|uniref:F-box domain-containing protein n=1 Tax=Rhodonia placenta TaxID=104341 RepID=A0A8H7P148_9APHY|nr:hypothetical protein IEO21_05838 [Postia placenta]